MNTSDASTDARPTAREICLGRERLRIPYNLVLCAATLIGMLIFSVPLHVLWYLAAFAVPANILYTFGPSAECYVSWLGWHSRNSRWLLWLIGTFMSAGVTIGTTEAILSVFAWSAWGDPPAIHRSP
jgi:hypothetical protein